MDDQNLERLIAQCKSNDVDAKVDAVTKLQHGFEAGIELPDTDGLIDALKTCLRASNHHLTSATLNALPPFFPLLTTGKLDDPDAHVDVNNLRHALTAFLPGGGLLDRLGDSRERPREKARESMVVLGGLAFRSGSSSLHMSVRSMSSGKGAETPLMIWERAVREGGLQSKVWRVREQTILILVHIRRNYSMFPLKPYLPQLVELLEDTDGVVRECARQSVVELFTGSTVTDAARADLKKEMSKKNVRKTIVDSVLQKLMAGGPRPGSAAGSLGQSDGGSEHSEPPIKREYIPPSLKLLGKQPTTSSMQTSLSRTVSNTASTVDTASRPVSRLGGDGQMTPTGESSEVATVYIASVKDLENEFAGMLKHFEGKETEHNWAARERSILRVRGMLKGDAHIRYADAFLACLKGGFIDGSFKTLASLRTTVAINTCQLYTEMAVELGPSIDSIVDPLMTRLIGMSALTKKIVASSSQQVADTIITNTTPQPKMFLNLIWLTMQDKNISSRQYSINHVKVFLDVHGQRTKHAIDGHGLLDTLEKIIKKSLGDSNPGVRESARAVFWVFEGIWQDRAALIMSTLDSTAKRQLEKACPEPGKASVQVTPKAKKSSVAAAIAASRAKAKAIATAPPTLRHQATSTSHILQQSAPPTQGSSPTSPKESLYTIRRPSSSRPTSPVSPSARKAASFSPTTSSPGFAPAPPVHVRTRSIDPLASPNATHRRFASAQLTPPASPTPYDTLASAAKTALPPSARNSLDGEFVLQASPPRQYRNRLPSKTRIPSPTRLPSPGRKSDIRSSLISFANNPRNLNGVDESLLLAQTIPLPEDSESEDDSHMMSFSAPFEKYNMSMPKTNASSISAGSPPGNAPEPIVEDALRARAEQAESAAERLLELNEPDDESAISPIPASLLLSNGNQSKSRMNEIPPSTPVNKKTTILRQAALFKDSPANKKSASLLDVLRERKHETGWWLKRISLVDKGSPLKGADQETQLVELRRFISALDDGTADVVILKKLALICIDNPVHDESSEENTSFSFLSTPTPANGKLGVNAKGSLWDNEKIFDQMFEALMKFLTLERSEEELEYGLIVLWEALDNQASLAEGRETEVFTHLLQIRFCNRINVLEATNTIRDALVARIDPVFGITTLHASLRSFYSEPVNADKKDEKSASYAFGLIALGKFILRLPAEILEDELPRLKTTLTTALSDSTSLVVRESAATCIIASQLVLRDETHLFTLLDGLPDEKKNLLTYLFDKHGARGQREAGGTERLEKEMRRLDSRTNTPPRMK